jgi:hypothetical protein
MQLKKKNIYDKIMIGMAALIWVLGLLAAGSDSVYMPWLNIAGAIAFLAVSLWLGRMLPRLEAEGSLVPGHDSLGIIGSVRTNRTMGANKPVRTNRPVGTRSFAKPFEKKTHSKVNTRYAPGWGAV